MVETSSESSAISVVDLLHQRTLIKARHNPKEGEVDKANHLIKVRLHSRPSTLGYLGRPSLAELL